MSRVKNRVKPFLEPILEAIFITFSLNFTMETKKEFDQVKSYFLNFQMKIARLKRKKLTSFMCRLFVELPVVGLTNWTNIYFKLVGGEFPIFLGTSFGDKRFDSAFSVFYSSLNLNPRRA